MPGATSTEEAEPAGEALRSGARPALIVAGTLVAVVALTFLIYSVGDYRGDDAVGGGSNLSGAAAAGACGVGSPDSSYTVAVASNPDPPRPEGTTLNFTVRQEGRAVTGAKVCLAADMPDMQHPGLFKLTKEVPGGQYEAQIQFGMGGAWKMALTVAEPGKPVVSVPLTLQVAAVSPS